MISPSSITSVLSHPRIFKKVVPSVPNDRIKRNLFRSLRIQFNMQRTCSKRALPHTLRHKGRSIFRRDSLRFLDTSTEGMRNSRRDAHLIESCAATHGVSSRAVRDWRTKEDPRWLAFLKSRAATSTLGLDILPSGKIQTPSEEEASAARRYDALQRMADDAALRNDVAHLPVLLKAAQEAHRLLQTVREGRISYESATGKLIDVDAYREVRDSVLTPLFQTVADLPRDAALSCNPENPDVARTALDSWLRDRLRPAMEKANSAFQK